MRAIGIDMGKDTFHAAFDDDHIVAFTNTNEGIDHFFTALLEHKFIKHRTRIGVESTGVYHLLLSARLREDGWNIVVINPLLSARAIANDSLRRVKTDKRDARIIRALVAEGKGYPYLDTDEIRKLQTLCAQRSSLIYVRAQCKQRLHAHSVRARAILSDNVTEPYTALMKKLTVDIRALERLMKKVDTPTQKLLRSIPGIGSTAAAMLIAYTGNIARFESAEQFVAYVGVDPRVYESGTSIHGKGYISKRGNKPLRHVLFMAAFIAQRHDPDLRAYYVKKRAEGKHHFSVLCAIERRLIHRIFAVWTRGTAYERRTPKA